MLRTRDLQKNNEQLSCKSACLVVYVTPVFKTAMKNNSKMADLRPKYTLECWAWSDRITINGHIAPPILLKFCMKLDINKTKPSIEPDFYKKGYYIYIIGLRVEILPNLILLKSVTPPIYYCRGDTCQGYFW
jgi:hypothetical protein